VRYLSRPEIDMPTVQIEVRQSYTPEEETALMDAVHAALCDAFKIPPGDRNIRLVVHEPHRFTCPPGRTQPAKYTLITIEAFAGRSLDAKRNLYRAIVANLEPLAIPKDHVMIVVHDIPRESWGVRGGQAASDVDLGFKVDV
jgi:phenylpyruvate tautomerase PptA (4-oxalocrotonate tautomerase family)